ncbi:hypothetical protein SKAU_G00199940 [Synaphobranchus kaupii]|uniref:Uncharacterized protein n=1 Tax=Synaphobranchus kaupii TaxID=118154 RepID=A0A9Q1FFM1_SYNKA|nr:hypothetical protein SKAU_G00199940 [Synaphobranchus kaupii]
MRLRVCLLTPSADDGRAVSSDGPLGPRHGPKASGLLSFTSPPPSPPQFGPALYMKVRSSQGNARSPGPSTPPCELPPATPRSRDMEGGSNSRAGEEPGTGDTFLRCREVPL